MHNFGYRDVLINIPLDIVKMIKDLGRMSSLDMIRQSHYENEFNIISENAMAVSIKFSNEIEGIITSDERIDDLIIRNDVPMTHNEQEIAGYRDALRHIHEDYLKMDFDKNTVMSLFRLMNGYVPERRICFKERDNAIIDIDRNGKRTMTFMPVPASDTADAFEQLELAYLDERDEMEPLLLIPCVILDFLCIHPFTDGNGRMSRLLTTLLLYNNGINVCSFVSMDEHIMSDRNGYYNSLSASSAGWHENKNDYFPFIRYFLKTLIECYMDLDSRFGILTDTKMSKDERIISVLKNSVTPLSKRQILKILPDLNPRTADSILLRLQKEGRIKKVGTYRDARYSYEFK